MAESPVPARNVRWLSRYKARMIAVAQLTETQAEACAHAESFETLSEGFEDDPEGAADEEMRLLGRVNSDGRSPVPALGSRPAQIHTLKTWPKYFKAIVDGWKTFELRLNDRGFAVGDCLVLQEFDPETGTFTREMFSVRVTYLTADYMPEGFVAMSIEPWEQSV